MADDYEAERPDEEQEGGPVKTFLEHLEDLRWVLIKSVATLGVAMVVCLIGANYVVKVIKWPLERARTLHPRKEQLVTFRYGTNVLQVLRLTPEERQAWGLGTNRFTTVTIEPTIIGTNHLIGWRWKPDPKGADRAKQLNIDLLTLSPAAGFLVAFQVAFYGGMVFAAPFIFYWVAAFVFPALKMRERKYTYRGLGFGFGLFLSGVAFCYFVLMPVALAASQMYSQWLGLGANQWKAEDYFSFVCKFMLGMGLGFELPVVLLTLVKIGVLSYTTLRRMWRYMIVINLFLGAILTTPEVITQILMATPLYVLYEISVWIAWYWDQPDRAKARRQLRRWLGSALIIIVLLWLGYKFGWPLLHGYGHGTNR